MTTVKYGIPFLLEDSTGQLSSSNFTDLHERMAFHFRLTTQDSHKTVYTIYDLSGHSPRTGGLLVPVATLTFGPGHSLGTVQIEQRPVVPMDHFLVKVNKNSLNRKFVASDGKEYCWLYRPENDDSEWVCANRAGTAVSTYDLKLAGEPSYPHSSGCVFSIEEDYPHLATELLATLLIMRNIAKYNL